MNIEETIEGLETAARSRDSASLRSALALVGATLPSDPGHRAALLHFLSAFAHIADLTVVDDAEAVSSALQHASRQGAFSFAEQSQLLDIHRTLLNRALSAGLKETAVAVASAAAACEALCEADRAILLALLLKSGRLDRRTVDLLKRFDAAPSCQTLLRALEQSHADVAAAAFGDSEAERAAAEWAIAQAPQAAWARRALAMALNRLREFDHALETISGLVDDADTGVLRAWALFGKRRFDEAEACLRPYAQSSQLAHLLQAMIAWVPAFESSSPSPFQSAAMSKEALNKLAEAQDAVAMLGPAALFAAGGVLAQAGRLHEGIEFRRQAVEQEATPEYRYGLIHLMQLAGCWEAASMVLDSAPKSSPAIVCLGLQQVQHDFGRVTSEDLASLLTQDADLLIRAKFSILTDEPCSYLDAPAGSTRDVAEETLRINLVLAVRSKDLSRLSHWMDEPMFHFLPAPETEFYRGVLAWLSGDSAIAERKLERAVELTLDFLPALRCLAAVKADQGDHRAAGAIWDKVTKLAPTDGRAFVHRALQFTAAGRIAEGIASLRSYCVRVPKDELALYSLARLELSAAFQRAAGKGDHEWEAVERLVNHAAAILDKLTAMPEAAWFAWVCKVMQTPAQSWPDSARVLLASEPAQSSAAPPMEAQWLRGHLRVLAGGFETALDGMRLLADFAGYNLSNATAKQLAAACWRVALQITTAEQATRLVACVEPIACAVSEIEQPLDFLAARFGVYLQMAGGNAQPSATVGNVRALLAAGDTETLSCVLDELRHNAEKDEKQRLLAGILALELKAFEAFEQVAAEASEERNWEILKAVALAKKGHKDAVGAFCALLERAGERSPSCSANLRLAGVLAFLGARARKHVRNRLVETLAAFPIAAAAGDHETALNFLRTSSLVGESKRATRLLESHRHLMTVEVHQELRRVRYYDAAQAIQTGDYTQAATVMREIARESEGDAAPELREIQMRAQQLAAVATLLEALSPNQTLRADAARFRGLADLLEGALEPEGSHRNAASRDRLRNRLADCRRNLSAAQWQAHFRSLAILHWEWGLAAMKLEPPLAEESLECFRFVNFIWRHLLTDAEFWTNFASVSGISLDEMAAVRGQIETEIFDCHIEQAHLYLTASDAEGCRFHLSCLQDWDRPPRAQFLTPEYVPTSRPAECFSLEQARSLNARASAAFETWIDQVLWRARKLRDDPSARDRLPHGMSCDYDTAIKMVNGALEAVPDHPRLCLFLIEQYADCAYALVGAGQYDDAHSRLQPAIPLVRRLANEQFRTKRATGPDGDLIRRVFDYAHKLEPDDQLRLRLLREYLHWNGPDADAEQRLSLAEAEAAYAAQDYDTAIKHLELIHGNHQAEELLLESLKERGIEQIKLGDEKAGYWDNDPISLRGLSSEDRLRLLAKAREKYQQAETDFAAAVTRSQQTDLQDLLRIARGRLEWLETQADATE